MVKIVVVKEEFAHIPQLTTQLNGRPLALNAAFKKTYPATAGKPERVVDVPLATQDQLRKLLSEGSPVLEEIEVEENHARPQAQPMDPRQIKSV